jgi:protein-L-isoaspartate(D-aspartate) O-methyltransferase
MIPPDRYAAARRRMVEEQIVPRGIRSPWVIDAMGRVPRHEFIPGATSWDAYGDHPLSIGFGQTISQPYMVAVMTEAMDLMGTENVLEIGTGSGYQTALLAEGAAQVYTVERVAKLVDIARETLNRLGYGNIEYKAGDGTLGWPEHAPYNAIIVTAGGPRLPDALKDQLAEGGRLVMPVGGRDIQELLVYTRKGSEGSIRRMGGCQFVKLIGVDGWRDV